MRLWFFSMYSSELFLLNTGIKVRWVTTSHPEMTICAIDFFISLVSKCFSCIYSFLQGMLYFGDVFFRCLWFSVLPTPAWNRFINDMVPTRVANHLFVLNSKSLFSRHRHTLLIFLYLLQSTLSGELLSFEFYYVIYVLFLVIIPSIASSGDPLPIHFLSGCWLKGFVPVRIFCANKSLLHFLRSRHLVCPVSCFCLLMIYPWGNPAASLFFSLESFFQNLLLWHFSIVSQN